MSAQELVSLPKQEEMEPVFWQNVAIYVLFCKNIDIDAIFLAKCRDLRTFFSVPPKQSKISPSSAFKFLSALVLPITRVKNVKMSA